MNALNSPNAVNELAEVVPRMKSGDRRELILSAATGVFGDFGYNGTTTDRVARAAGVSQPYVVRMFGTKEKLFIEVLHRALGTLIARFREVIAASTSPQNLTHQLGVAYVDLLKDRGLLLSLMHAFVSGSDPEIGRVARGGFLEVYALLRDDAGYSPEQTRAFLSNGMLINTLVGLRMSEEFASNPMARELMECALPEKLDLVLELGDSQRPDTA